MIYDIMGRAIAKLVDAHQAPGTYQIRWDGRDEHGQAVASGLYVCEMVASGVAETRKMMVVR